MGRFLILVWGLVLGCAGAALGAVSVEADSVAIADTAGLIQERRDTAAVRRAVLLTGSDSALLRRFDMPGWTMPPRPRVDLSFKPSPRRRVFFELHDLAAEPLPRRVSGRDFFPEGGGREFRYLWSGDYTPWRSQGAADYWERGRKAHVFHFFREGGKLRGWGWERRD